MSKSLDHQVLDRAEKLIKTKWARSSFAKDKLGKACAILSPEAETFCAVGALMRSIHDITGSSNVFQGPLYHQLAERLDDEADKLYGDDLIGVNDRIGQPEVLTVFETVREEMIKV